jgi:2-iminobutanoate/2-iminopropanoate deaminase
VGAGRVGELVFLGQIGRHKHARATLERLGQALAQQDLRLEDLLRLRIFVADLNAEPEIEQALEKLLPRHRWPAITLVEMPACARSPRGALSFDAIASGDPHLSRQPIGSLEPRRGEEQRRPAAVRYGPWVFVGAVVGESQHRHPLLQRIESESQSLFARMERLLHTAGASLADVVKVGGWLTFPMSGYEPLGEVRSELLAQGLMPASAAVQMGRLPGAGKPLLSFEAIAFAPVGEAASSEDSDAGCAIPIAKRSKPLHRLSDLTRPSSLAAYYATARRAGDYVFTCGEIPRSRASVGEQASDVYEQLSSHLQEHGASPSDTVHQTVFVRNRKDISALKAAIRPFCDSQIPATVIPAADMGFRPGVDVEIELIAESQERESGERT